MVLQLYWYGVVAFNREARRSCRVFKVGSFSVFFQEVCGCFATVVSTTDERENEQERTNVGAARMLIREIENIYDIISLF